MQNAQQNDAEIGVSDLATLEKRVDELLDLCTRLRRENQALRDKQRQLLAERATLRDQNQQARGRVEDMIERLKSLEAGS